MRVHTEEKRSRALFPDMYTQRFINQMIQYMLFTNILHFLVLRVLFYLKQAPYVFRPCSCYSTDHARYCYSQTPARIKLSSFLTGISLTLDGDAL